MMLEEFNEELGCSVKHNICSIDIPRFNKSVILAHFNFGIHDLQWFQIVKKISSKFVTFSYFSIKLYTVTSIRIPSLRGF